MKLSKKQAKNLSDIMGVRYSHHDENMCYTDHGDINPMIYFYQGMSPYTFKLDTVTGIVSDIASRYTELMKNIIDNFKENNVILDEEKTKFIKQWESEYADWDEKQASVLKFLESEGLLDNSK